MHSGFARIVSQNAIDHDDLFSFCKPPILTTQQTLETSPLRLSGGRWQVEPGESV